MTAKKRVSTNTVPHASFSLIPWASFAFGSLLFGSVGSIFTAPAIPHWYRLLLKPPFNPPNWIFGPVWTILFLLMGTSAYLIYQQQKHQFRKHLASTHALTIYVLQFGFNMLWSFLFFGVNNLFLSVINIMILWGLILLMIYTFYKISKTAAYLLIPYLLWVSFASYLNIWIYFFNR